MPLLAVRKNANAGVYKFCVKKEKSFLIANFKNPSVRDFKEGELDAAKKWAGSDKLFKVIDSAIFAVRTIKEEPKGGPVLLVEEDIDTVDDSDIVSVTEAAVEESKKEKKVYINTESPVEESDIDDDIKTITSIVSSISEKEEELQRQIKEIESQFVDIYHFIEFYDLDAASGYKIYKLLQSKLRERRVLKDELSKIDAINKSELANSISYIANFLNTVESKDRCYVPREMKELFTSKKIHYKPKKEK